MKEYLLDEAEYHQTDAPTYRQPNNGAFKKGQYIANVRYEPSHFNPYTKEEWRGAGVIRGKWIFNEEPAKAEGLLSSNIELMMDTTVEPNASIGLHQHDKTEELYYVLSGSIEVTLLRDECEDVEILSAGDAHRIAPGQSHFIKAGAQGARIIVVAAKVTPE